MSRIKKPKKVPYMQQKVELRRNRAILNHTFRKGSVKTMGLIALDSLETGMVLASDVLDRNGRMLLGAGAELNQKHLTIFRTWGVAEVDIAGIDYCDNGPTLPVEVDPLAVAAAEESLQMHFRHCGTEHPALRELLRLAAIRKVQHGLC